MEIVKDIDNNIDDKKVKFDSKSFYNTNSLYGFSNKLPVKRKRNDNEENIEEITNVNNSETDEID